MPPHIVCQACGYRTPVEATPPQGIRTWDSTRDEERYEREKKRRQVAEQKRQTAVAQLAVPASRPRASRVSQSNVVEMAQRKAR
jgi:hypothetical protein